MAIIFIALFFFTRSLFSNELDTQPEGFLLIGVWIYLFGGMLILIGTLSLQVSYTKIKRMLPPADEKSDGPGYDGRVLISALIVIAASWVLTIILFIDSSDDLIALPIMGAVLLLLSFLNWKVVDIPARILSVTGDESALRISTYAAVPMVIAGFSFIPLISVFFRHSAPHETIVTAYLESLFALGVLCTFASLINIHRKLRRRIDAMEKKNGT